MHALAQYQLPPQTLRDIVDAPRPPVFHIGPKRDIAALVAMHRLPGIAEIAEPRVRLAGLQINPRTRSSERRNYGSTLTLLDIATGKEMAVSNLPAKLRLASLLFSPDQQYIAFTHLASADGEDARVGLELWLVNRETLKAHRLLKTPILAVFDGFGFQWTPDSKGILVQIAPLDGKTMPTPPAAPVGPVTADSAPGQKKSFWTRPTNLRSAHDDALFQFLATVQLAIVKLDGAVNTVGGPDMHARVKISPNGSYFLTEVLNRPFSRVLPAESFNRRIEVRDLQGRVVHVVAKSARGDQGDQPGMVKTLKVGWRADAPATLVWAERKSKHGDLVLMQAAPFVAPARRLAQLEYELDRISWSRGDLAVLTEESESKLLTRHWRMNPDQADEAPSLMFSHSSESRYEEPGTPFSEPDSSGQSRLLVASDGSMLLHGRGASEEGDQPFIDRYNFLTKKKERIFQSVAPYFEEPIAVLDQSKLVVLTRRESATEHWNYFVQDLMRHETRQLTKFFPSAAGRANIQQELIRYKRADGVPLTGKLYLPAGYRPETDGPLPTLMWAYPHDFTDAAAAGETRGSPYRYKGFDYNHPSLYAALGYAVLDDIAMPIVGGDKAKPNDTLIAQLVANAEAAVAEVVRRGVADKRRIAIGGHSYGAFMTANLLAHTRLFRAGIARSGAYNRTLTPFGFQSEKRTLWQAKDMYTSISPFNDADKIKDALLIIHGEQDENQGTYPIQSERMFQAVNSLGGTARLVMLPGEGHWYQARESVLHVLSETHAWLEKYVRRAEQ